MSDREPGGMPIGAVTRLTGISTHTLRKWESRYGAIEPLRTDTGRRVYTQEQVDRLIRLRDLIGQGHQISQLCMMSDAELAALAEEGSSRGAELAIDRAIAVGPVLAALLSATAGRRDIELIARPAAEWLTDAAVPAGSQGSALVLDLPTLTETSVRRLVELRRECFARVIVVYGFASRRTLRRLLDGGILCLKGPTTAVEILRNMQVPGPQRSVLAALEEEAMPAHRYSESVIARVLVAAPKLQCECPNHIAQLLLDIGAFEQYSMECEDSDPNERALHARLRLIAANARALFEEAMADVAANEGLELEEL